MAKNTIDVNAPATIGSAILLGVIGVLSFIIQPGIVQGFVMQLKVSESRAVDLAGIEMAGVAIAAVLMALLAQRFDWRRLTLIGLLLAVSGNIASAALLNKSGFDVARFATGLGEGMIISINWTFLGLTKRIDRNLSIFLVAVLTYGAVGLWILPRFLDAYGLAAMFYGFAIISLAGLLTLPFLPRSFESLSEPSPLARQLSNPLLGVALLGVLSYNLAQGIAWAILFLVGVGAGLKEQLVADALFLSQIVAIAGALASVFLAERIGRWIAIAFGVCAGATCIGLLLGAPSLMIFTFAVCGFNFLWNFVLPFIFGAVGDFDVKGRMISLAIAVQMVGLGGGPLIAARLISNGSYRSTELLCIVFFILSYGLITLPMLKHQKLLNQNINI